MAFVICDSFQHWRTNSQFSKWIYEGGVGINTTAGVGRRGGAGLQYGNGNYQARLPLGAEYTTLVVGFALKARNANSGPMLNLKGIIDGPAHISLEWDASLNRVDVRRGAGGTILGSSGNNSFVVGDYRHFMLKAVIHDTTGSVKLWIDSVLVVNLSNIDTRNGGTNGRVDALGINGPGGGFDMCDLWVTDSEEWGDMRVDYVAPTAEGNSAQFTPSSGTDNALMVDETGDSDEDTTYVETSTVGDKDTLVMTDLTGTASIKAVQGVLRARKTDAGASGLTQVVRIGGTDYDVGSELVLGSTYGMSKFVPLQNSPATASAWGVTEFNNAEFGYRRSS